MDRGEKGMNPVAMTVSILRNNIAQARDWTSDPQFSSPQTLWGLARVYLLNIEITENRKYSNWFWIVRTNPFPHNDAFWSPWETSLLKTLWEKEKLLVTRNFFFSPSVFYPSG